jgi:GNAT superfamily N-acetyltransferase
MTNIPRIARHQEASPTLRTPSCPKATTSSPPVSVLSRLLVVDGDVVGGVFAFPLTGDRLPASFGPTSEAPWTPGEYYIDSLAGKGQGRALMSQVVRDASSAGCHAVSLEVYTNNTRAYDLYSKNGFKALSSYADATGEEVQYMVLTLSSIK